MRRILACLLALSLVMGVLPAVAEETGGRGGVEIVDEPIEGEDEITEEELGIYNQAEDDWVVYDPVEEFLYDEEEITQALDKLDGMRNILLLGVDSRSNEIYGRTDTMILLTVDIERKIIKMTSFLRDTYVEIPNRKNNRLNAAFVFGGYELLADTLYTNFGIRPDAYVAINLKGLTKVIDALGGVYVTVKETKVNRVNAVIYWYNKQVLGLSNPRVDYLTKGGYQLLNGKQAEAWARYRYSESDQLRTERQRELITIIFNKIADMSVMELAAFAVSNASLVETNLSLAEIASLAPAVLAMKDAEIRQLRLPLDNTYANKTISGMAVMVPNRQTNSKALADFLAE